MLGKRMVWDIMIFFVWHGVVVVDDSALLAVGLWQ